MNLAWRLNTLVLVPALTLLAVRSGAQTRPLLTEEARTARHGTIVLEIGAEAIRDEPNFLTRRLRDSANGPTFRAVFSPADVVEIDLEWVGRVAAFDDPDFGNVSDFGDVSLRAKVRVAAGSATRPTLALRFGTTLPETSFGNGLGPNVLRMSADALLSQPFGGFTLHANAGLGIHDEVLRPHEQRDFLTYGLALERALGGHATALAEIAGRAGSGQPGAEARSEARLGLRLGAGRVSWDVGVRRGLAEADGTWGATLGLRWLLARR